VAILTNIAGVDVRRVFAGGGNPVVTTRTVTDSANVIEIRWHPSGCSVAVIAGIAAGHMRWRLAGCDYAVVARTTGADYVRMIDYRRRQPCNDVVAIFTDGRR